MRIGKYEIIKMTKSQIEKWREDNEWFRGCIVGMSIGAFLGAGILLLIVEFMIR